MSRYQVPDNVLSALIKQESGGNRNAVSNKGARGLAQIMPATAANPGYGIAPLRDNSDAEQKRFARDYLGTMVDKTGSLPLGLAAYNSGLGTVLKAKGQIPNIPETQNYVSKILKSLNPISEASANETPWTHPNGAPSPQEWIKARRSQQKPGSPSPQEWLAKKRAQPIPEEPKTLEGFGKNVNRDIKDVGQGAIDMGRTLNPVNKAMDYIRNPKETFETDVQNLKNLPTTAVNAVKSIGQSIAHPIDSAYNAPISTAMNIAGVAGIAKNAAKGLTNKLTSSADEIAAINKTNALNAPKREVLKMVQKEGLAVPSSEVNPSTIRNSLEGVAGKAALGQQAVINNQKILTALARKGLGLADDVPITHESLADLRKTHYKPYEDVAALPNQPSLATGYSVNTHVPSDPIADLKAWQQANTDARGYYNAAQAQGGNPDLIAKANAAKADAARLQSVFERKAQAAGKPELVQQLKDARVKLAEIHTVEKAINPGTGEINPAVFGKRLQEGKPLGTEFKKIAKFNRAFPKFAKSAEGAQVPGVSKVNAPVAIGLGALVGDGAGFATGMASMLVPDALRKYMLSPKFQSKYSIIAEQSPREANKLLKFAASGNATPNKLNAALLAASSKDKK